MEYGLTKRVLGRSTFTPISKDRYYTIQRAREGIFESLFFEEKYDLIVENYLEFETALQDIIARNMIRLDHSYRSSHLERVLVDRKIANLLSAARLYVDRVEHHVHRILALDSATTFDVQATLSKQYDLRFGYRCMEALRNYVQHRGLPVHNIRFENQWVERKSNNLMLHALSPYVAPARLREDDRFKKAVLKEMEAHGDKIDLKEITRDYVEGLSLAHSEIRDNVSEYVRKWDAIVMDTVSQYATASPDGSTLGLCAVKRLANGHYADWISVFTDPIEQRQYFESKNGKLTNLLKRFMTSEVIHTRKI